MKKQYTSLTCDMGYFSARQEGPVVIFRPKGNQLLANEQFTAYDAKELGLANRCVPVKELEATALAVAQQFEKLPETSLRTAKRLANNTAITLEEYLEFENQELFISLVHQKQMTL